MRIMLEVESLPTDGMDLDVFDVLEILIRERAPGSAVLVLGPAPGVEELHLFHLGILIHVMYVLGSKAAGELDVVGPIVPSHARAVPELTRAWLVVPDPFVGEAHERMQMQRLDPAVGSYSRGADGAMRIRWW